MPQGPSRSLPRHSRRLGQIYSARIESAARNGRSPSIHLSCTSRGSPGDFDTSAAAVTPQPRLAICSRPQHSKDLARPPAVTFRLHAVRLGVSGAGQVGKRLLRSVAAGPLAWWRVSAVESGAVPLRSGCDRPPGFPSAGKCIGGRVAPATRSRGMPIRRVARSSALTECLPESTARVLELHVKCRRNLHVCRQASMR
jgi:hypothetical protein